MDEPEEPIRIRVLKSRCVRGHLLTEENLYTRPDGRKTCRECRRYHSKQSEQKRRDARKRSEASDG